MTKKPNPNKKKVWAVKRELEEHFPGVKFGVFMGISESKIVMSVQWVDGPTEQEVVKAKDILKKDYYCYFGERGSTNYRINSPIGKRDFIFNTSRSFSQEVFETVIGELEGAGISSDSYSTFPKNKGMYLTLEDREPRIVKEFYAIVNRRF